MSRESLGLSDNVLQYLRAHSVREHPTQVQLREYTASMEKAAMQISPEQGEFMRFMIGVTGARHCLEIGVFTGYSALTVALALPEDGTITAFDVSHEWTNIGRPYWEKAGVASKIELHIEPAVHGLQRLVDNGKSGTYDFAFIDADKVNYLKYYDHCVELLSPGGLILIDNVLWSGAVADPAVNDPDTVAIRELNSFVYNDDRTDSCMIPVGDGLMLCRKQ